MQHKAPTPFELLSSAELRDFAQAYRADAFDKAGWIRPALAQSCAEALEILASQAAERERTK